MYLLSRLSFELPLYLCCLVCVCIVAIIGRFRTIQWIAFTARIDVGENGSGITDLLAIVAKEVNAEALDNEVRRCVGA